MTRGRRMGVCFLAQALLAGPIMSVEQAEVWHDPSPHKIQFVTVEKGVRLEVLDWGGTGRPVVLLAGSGNTAHVFDDFAPKLSACGHVYGITRRGYGASSHPKSGYSEQRLAEDVLQVMDQLKLVKPILMGHSMSGEEMTRLGDEHSDRLAGLIYLDAADDPTDWPGSHPGYVALFDKLPEGRRNRPEPSDADMKSFHAYHEWQLQNINNPFPESELRNMFATNPDGSVGEYKASTDAIHKAIGDGAQPRDYSKIRVPILAFFSWPCSKKVLGDYVCVEHPHHSAPYPAKPEYAPKNAQEQAAIDAFDDATLVYINRWNKKLLAAPGGVRLVDLPGADHYVYISNEEDVLQETRAFLDRMR